MSDTLFFLHSNPQSVFSLAAPLASRGFAIEISSPNEPDVCCAIAESQPVALVVSLEDQPAAAREVAAGVLADARISRPLLMFVGGSPDEVERTRESLPFGVFVKPDEVTWSLKRLAVTV